MRKTRLSVDLEDPYLLKLLKEEAALSKKSIKDVLTVALEMYFFNRLKKEPLVKASESVFKEWSDTRDAEYDDL